MKSNRTHTPPPVIEDLGDGTSHYNFDVINSQREDEDSVTENYDYDQVTVVNPVTLEKIKEELLKEGYDHEPVI